jgi:hypothetical protein
MFSNFIMSNYNLIRLLTDISDNHLFYKWNINSYRKYIKNIVTNSDVNGHDFVFNKFQSVKLPFVIFRTDDTFYYINKHCETIKVNKLDKTFTTLDEYDLGHKSGISFILKNVVSKV